MDQNQIAERGKGREIFWGVGIVFLLHLLQGLLYLFLYRYGQGGLLPDFFFIIAVFGAIQLIYVAPALGIALRKGRKYLAWGMLIAASLTLFLNVLLWVFVLSGPGLTP